MAGVQLAEPLGPDARGGGRGSRTSGSGRRGSASARCGRSGVNSGCMRCSPHSEQPMISSMSRRPVRAACSSPVITGARREPDAPAGLVDGRRERAARTAAASWRQRAARGALCRRQGPLCRALDGRRCRSTARIASAAASGGLGGATHGAASTLVQRHRGRLARALDGHKGMSDPGQAATPAGARTTALRGVASVPRPRVAGATRRSGRAGRRGSSRKRPEPWTPPAEPPAAAHQLSEPSRSQQ